MKKIFTCFRRVFSKKNSCKLLSVVLCLLLFFYAAPPVLYAEAADAIKSIGDEGTDDVLLDNINQDIAEQEALPIIYDVYELTELREENVKHFRDEDGSYVAAQYNYPVHYMDEYGVWQDIDNTLESKSDGTFSNKNERIKFVKKIPGNGEIYTLKDKGTKLTFYLSGAEKGTQGTVENTEEAENLTELQKMMNLEGLSSSVTYENILDGVDIEYVVYSGNVKENIIVKQRQESYSYTFILKLNGLTASFLDGENILIYDQNGDVKYRIPAPVVYDANMTDAPDGTAWYTFLHAGNGKYMLTVNVSEVWMNDTDRAFPVTVDPVITFNNSTAQDTYISPTSSTVSHGNSATVNVSTGNIGYWKTTSLPLVPNLAHIVDAEIRLSLTSSSGYIGAYEVLTDWNESLTYNQYVNTTSPKGAIGSVLLDYNTVSLGLFSWKITSLVQSWYNVGNYGVAFKAVDGYTCSGSFYSSESAKPLTLPMLKITYKNMSGIEDYYSYSTHSIGNAGIGNINLATGQLNLAIPTISTTDSLMPYTPTLVYNSHLAGYPYVYGRTESAYSSYFMPYGFKLNITETVVKKSFVNETNTTKYYYVYTDADGSEHGFSESGNGSNVFVDENGLAMQLTEDSSSGNVTITDDSKISRTFVKMVSNFSSAVERTWLLTKITDAVGNSIQFTFDSLYRPTKVTLVPYSRSAIDMLELYYYSSGMLRMVYNPTSKDAAVFRYSDTPSGVLSSTGKYLRQIDYAHGSSSVTYSNWESFASSQSYLTNITVDATASYEYSGNYIVSAKDNLSGQSIVYTLLGDKIKEVTHYGGTTLGQTLEIAYYVGFTDTVASGNDEILYTADDLVTRYTYDNEGRVVSVYSFEQGNTEIHGATVGKYETQENIKNNLKEQTLIGGSSVNYLLNGDFEEYEPNAPFDNYWFATGNVWKVDETRFEGEGDYSARILPDLGGTAMLSQYVVLTPGWYTLAFPYHTQACKGVVGWVSITSAQGTGFQRTDTISLNENLSNGIKPYFSISFQVPTWDILKIDIAFERSAYDTETPIIEIDRVVLSHNIGATDFSLVSYGGFYTTGYNASGLVPVSSFWSPDPSLSEVAIVSSDYPFDIVAQVTGELTSERYIKQRVYEAPASYLYNYDYNPSGPFSNAGYDYIVGGFAKAVDASYAEASKFRIRVDVIYYQGTNGTDAVVSHYFDFLPGVGGWQFTGGSFSTQYTAAEGDTNDYRCVKAIDLYCEYSYQPGGLAFFDNISLINTTSSDVEKYTYYSNGLLMMKENIFYTEYYEYDTNRNLVRVANNRGEMTDYIYSGNKISSSVDYSFKDGSSYDYPIYRADRDSIITKTPKARTDYTYNTQGLCTAVETYELNSSGSATGKKISNTYSYETTYNSRIFGALLAETDSLGNTVRYYYNSANGRLMASVNEEENTGLAYTYDTRGNLTAVMPASYVSQTQYTTLTAQESIAYTYNSNGLLSSITTPSTVYSFTYDPFGNASTVSAGNNTLATYTYNERNGKLNKVTYGNGFIVEYEYNTLEQLTKVWYTNNGVRYVAYSYTYTADGQVSRFSSGRITEYKYDVNGRLTGFVEYDNSRVHHNYSSEIIYNDKGEVGSLSYKINYGVSNVAGIGYLYSYDSEGRVKSVSLSSPNATGWENVTYDALGRIENRQSSYSSGGVSFSNSVSYEYTQYLLARTSPFISEYTNTVNGVENTFRYTYDGNGYISSVTYCEGRETRYVYDNLGQLIREDNEAHGNTYVYTYDYAGNLTSVLVYDYTSKNSTPTNLYFTRTYAYSGGGDLLTSFEGMNITYDAIGNPTSYRGMTFTWTGRLLTGAVVGDKVMSFTYNDEGIRTSKTVNGVTTTYYLDGSRIVGEETNGNVTVYIYDSTGAPIGYQAYANGAWSTYWYLKNLQGDIIYVYDSAGNYMASYEYDAYGSYMYGHFGDSSYKANDPNPFRYRGYYYDKDLDLYYVNGRYYDDWSGRWINADKFVSTAQGLLSCNMFAYCENNPVNRVDYSGEFWHIVVGATAGAIISSSTTLILSLINSGDIDWCNVSVSAITGAASGALASTGVGWVGMISGNSAISMAGNVVSQVISNSGFSNFEVDIMLIEGILGAVSGVVGGEGKGSKYLTNLGKQTVKRTANITANKGIKAGLKEAGKAFAYYSKSSVKYYKDFITRLPMEIVYTYSTSVASSYIINQYRQILER